MIEDALIKKRLETLEQAKENLKKYFVGLDSVIDDIFLNIDVWYVFPDLLTRPLIVNLWGLTGVGKTDLIRRLVKELGLNDSFLEIQLETKSGSNFNECIQENLENAKILPGTQGVLLLDEIQRFQTMDKSGETIENNQYEDIWCLLSDGKFSDANFRRQKIYNHLMNMMYDQDRAESSPDCDDEDDDVMALAMSDESVETKTKQRKYQTSLWSAGEFKTVANSDLEIEEIMKLNRLDKIAILKTELKKLENKTHETEVYSKLLIFICGNLDEAYSMSKDVAELNVDADILHEHSKKISVITIKDALSKKFKPEQIARFGNVHIIYPSLSTMNFQNLIAKRLCDISDRIHTKFGITVEFTPNLYNSLYRNGVYPAQGVRPVFSTISSVIENSVPYFLYRCLTKKIKAITLDIDENSSTIKAIVGEETLEKKVLLSISNLEKNIDINDFTCTVVHECGHALIYSVLFHTVPQQINVKCVGDSFSGFVAPHGVVSTPDNLKKLIQVYYGGLVAEELVFGEPNKTFGARADLESATRNAANLVRAYNMTEQYHGVIVPEATEGSNIYLTNISETNAPIEGILREQKMLARKVLEDNIEFYKELVNKLKEEKIISPENFYNLAKKYVPTIELRKNDYMVSHNYDKDLTKFLNDR